MAIYRQVQMTFWTDTKVADDFTPEDRYFYLYLFTNPHTNLAGCYEISIRQMSIELGYSKETVRKLIDRMSTVHKVIVYSDSTKEVLILNWNKYNWTQSEKFRKPLWNEINEIKEQAFANYLKDIFNGVVSTEIRYPYGIDTVSDQVGYPIDTTVTVTVSDTVTDSVIDNSIYINIINYLNSKTGRRFSHSSKAVMEAINARLKEGYTEDDFKKVIDNKCHEWLGTEQEQFLRPSTLFAPSHFDEYLNQGMVKKRNKSGNEFNQINRSDYDFDALEEMLGNK